MPFVRYARDRRGYETLYVMHAVDGGEKNPRVRVLYACRTVPHAKVGRHTLDDVVQRRIEEAYPALQFDWPKLLKDAAASAPRPERTDSRATEPRGKQRRDRKPRAQQGNQVPRVPSVPQVPQVRFAEPVVSEVQVQGVQAPEPVERAGLRDAPEMLDVPEQLESITELVEWVPLDEPEEPEPEPAEQRTEPGEPMERGEPMEPLQVPYVPEHIGPLMVDRSWPVVGSIGADRALILRGRYIELAHRILSRVSSPADRARLLREAARLNPENWKTDEQAQAGVAAFEELHTRLAEQLRRQPPV